MKDKLRWNVSLCLVQLVLQHYKEVLGQSEDTFEPVNLGEIAKKYSEGEIVKLTQMVIGCVVQSENNQEYVERITTLDPMSQGVLMHMIQEVMAKSQRDADPTRHRSFSVARFSLSWFSYFPSQHFSNCIAPASKVNQLTP